MWTRKELKQRAKEALQRNYWKIVLVSVLAIVLGGGLGYSSGTAGPRSVSSVTAVETVPVETVPVETVPEVTTEDGDSGWTEMIVTDEAVIRAQDEEYFLLDEIAQSLIDASEDMDNTMLAAYVVTVLIIGGIIFLVVLVIVGAVAAFLYNPFRVGVDRFMLKSVDDKAEIKEIAYAFDHSYINVVKTMFHMDLRVFLWALLFVIPGIYKKYQYRMVPYILAERPDMDYKEVLQMSRDLMDGEKWHAFVLDLSFILWHMLGMITCGIVEVFYVHPYMELTDASLYRKLCELHENTNQKSLPDGAV